ncbi:Peroxisome chaperone and import receptor [Ascosphaera acerosa]|nr:Peroxisome chaperone and import receptor [Ascosphaera acerosa]
MNPEIEEEGPFGKVKVTSSHGDARTSSAAPPSGQSAPSIQDQLRAINEQSSGQGVPRADRRAEHGVDETAPSSAGKTAGDGQGPTERAAARQEGIDDEVDDYDDDVDDDDDDEELDELDDMLDSFAPTLNHTRTTIAAATSATATSRAASETKSDRPAAPLSQEGDFDEEEFIKQLEAGMAEMMSGGGGSGGLGGASGTAGSASAADAATPSKSAQGTAAGASAAEPEMSDWDAITKQMSEDPNTAELMKMLMGETPAAKAESPASPSSRRRSPGRGPGSGVPSRPATASSGNATRAEESFQETIRKTMERMRESGDKATAAAAEDADGGMLTQLLRAMESGVGAGLDGDGEGDGSLDKMLMGLMEQMTNKDILYEPMSELNAKFGPWLKENRGKVEEAEYQRFEKQAAIVKEIVDKFEEKGYSDEKSEDRAYIWDKMQKMQATGGPPEDLVANPFGNDDPGLGEAFKSGAEDPGCPQQ